MENMMSTAGISGVLVHSGINYSYRHSPAYVISTFQKSGAYIKSHKHMHAHTHRRQSRLKSSTIFISLHFHSHKKHYGAYLNTHTHTLSLFFVF